MALHGAPLCPAILAGTWHLPLKGGDRPAGLPAQSDRAGVATTEKLLISPLEGEMSGRTEGGEIIYADPPCATERLP
jgi:hypothetical protein